MTPLAQCRLYTFVDTAYLHGRAPEELARQLCAGGSDILQLRAKNQTPAEVLRLAEKIQPITAAAGVWFVINDHPAIASQTGAAICHLGQEDFFDAGHTHVSEIPSRTAGLKIGLSSHAPAQAQRAIDAGADYIAIGPVYATGTKPTARPVTLEYVKWAAQNVQIPWFAIGGINFETLDAVLAAGAQRICVVSAILNAPKPAEACQIFKDRILSAAPIKP
jgi:thiamine-phosphate pyrophosphorylase